MHPRLPTVTSPAPPVRTTDHVLLRRAAVERCREVAANCRSTQTGRLLGTEPAERLASKQRDHLSWERVRGTDTSIGESVASPEASVKLGPQSNQIQPVLECTRSMNSSAYCTVGQRARGSSSHRPHAGARAEGRTHSHNPLDDRCQRGSAYRTHVEVPLFPESCVSTCGRAGGAAGGAAGGGAASDAAANCVVRASASRGMGDAQFHTVPWCVGVAEPSRVASPTP